MHLRWAMSSDHPATARNSSPTLSTETPNPPGKVVCLRQTPRQATSAVANTAPEPAADDPLLGLARAGRLRFRSDSAPYLHKQPRRN